MPGAAEARNAALSPRELRLARVKDGLVATVLVTGVATAVEGVRFSRSAPGGAVPLADGSTPGPETPASAARRKRRLDALGAVTLVSEAALVAVNGALAQENFRRPPGRLRVRRRNR